MRVPAFPLLPSPPLRHQHRQPGTAGQSTCAGPLCLSAHRRLPGRVVRDRHLCPLPRLQLADAAPAPRARRPHPGRDATTAAAGIGGTPEKGPAALGGGGDPVAPLHLHLRVALGVECRELFGAGERAVRHSAGVLLCGLGASAGGEGGRRCSAAAASGKKGWFWGWVRAVGADRAGGWSAGASGGAAAAVMSRRLQRPGEVGGWRPWHVDVHVIHARSAAPAVLHVPAADKSVNVPTD